MTIWGFTPLEFVCNIVFYFEFCLFFHMVLTPRFKRSRMFLSYSVLVLALLAMSNVLPRMSILRVLQVPIALMVFNCIFYKDKLLRCVFCAWVVVVIILFSEYVCLATLYVPEVLSGSLSSASVKDQVFVWSVEMTSAGVMYWLTALALNRVRNRFNVREMLMYSFFPVSQFLLLYGWLNATRLSGEDRHQLLIIVVMLLCLAADVGLFASMFRVSRQIELETENRLLAAKIEAQRAHYEELTAQYDNIRRMRHDIAKHINAMDALLAAGREEEAAAYAAELAETYDRNEPKIESEPCGEKQ